MSSCSTHIPIRQLKHLDMDITRMTENIIYITNTHKKLYFLKCIVMLT